MCESRSTAKHQWLFLVMLRAHCWVCIQSFHRSQPGVAARTITRWCTIYFVYCNQSISIIKMNGQILYLGNAFMSRNRFALSAWNALIQCMNGARCAIIGHLIKFHFTHFKWILFHFSCWPFFLFFSRSICMRAWVCEWLAGDKANQSDQFACRVDFMLGIMLWIIKAWNCYSSLFVKFRSPIPLLRKCSYINICLLSSCSLTRDNNTHKMVRHRSTSEKIEMKTKKTSTWSTIWCGCLLYGYYISIYIHLGQRW